jgi:hypothetical protein
VLPGTKNTPEVDLLNRMMVLHALHLLRSVGGDVATLASVPAHSDVGCCKVCCIACLVVTDSEQRYARSRRDYRDRHQLQVDYLLAQIPMSVLAFALMIPSDSMIASATIAILSLAEMSCTAAAIITCRISGAIPRDGIGLMSAAVHKAASAAICSGWPDGRGPRLRRTSSASSPASKQAQHMRSNYQLRGKLRTNVAGALLNPSGQHELEPLLR